MAEPTNPPLPEDHKNSGTLAWLIPILIASAVFLAICLDPAAFMRDSVFFPLLIAYGLIAPAGGFWAIYQSIRYESHPWRCVAIVMFVPFGFLWYYFERYRKRVAQEEVVDRIRGADNTPH